MTNVLAIRPPKAVFKQTQILHDAIISQQTSAVGISLDRADTVMRAMNKISDWQTANSDIIGTWMRGGDPWMDMIKSVRAYGSQVVTYHKAVDRAAIKLEKERK